MYYTVYIISSLFRNVFKVLKTKHAKLFNVHLNLMKVNFFKAAYTLIYILTVYISLVNKVIYKLLYLYIET